MRLARLLLDLESLARTEDPTTGQQDAAVATPDADGEASGLRLPAKLTGRAALDAFGRLALGDHLHPESLLRLLEEMTATLEAEATLLDLSAAEEVCVVGDLHGSLECLQLALRACGAADGIAPGHVVLFNGDFIDRGEHSTEVVASLLLLKAAHPRQVYLLRGNHEDGSIATVYGMRDEVRAKHPAHAEALWAALLRFFGALPIAAHTADAFVVHGGLPSLSLTLDHLRQLPPEVRAAPSVLDNATIGQCATDTRGVAMLRGLLWSDPVAAERGLEQNRARGDAGMLYGTDVTRQWLLAHGLRTLVRSHQVVEDGWERIDCGEGTSLFTVFSCADYPNAEGFNRGAVLRLPRGGAGGAEPTPVEFSLSEAPAEAAAAAAAEAQRRQRHGLEALVLANRQRLEQDFEAEAPSGRIGVDAWTEVMRRTLCLDLDWRAVQPEIAATVKRVSLGRDGSTTLSDTGMIDHRRFVETAAASAAASAVDGGDDGSYAALYGNAPQLKTVFRFLDKDDSGVIDADEFRNAIELLNRRKPDQAQTDIDALFKAIDLDGNGMIEFDEFCEVFKL